MIRAPGGQILLALVALGCADLPSIPTGVCGNGIIEPPEDCDTFAPSRGAVCRPKGDTGACHLDCRLSSDGSRPACPPGWGCDAESLCREPTGDFSPPSSFPVGSSSALLSGDFDGDGRAEVISEQPPDAFQRTYLSFHYFDAEGQLEETRRLPKFLASPVLLDVSGDHRSDLLFTDFRIGVLPGRTDRAWVPETFHSYALPDAGVRMFSVRDDPVESDSALIALTTVAHVYGMYVPDPVTGRLLMRGELPGPVESLAGDPVIGDVIEGSDSRCREAMLALRGASTFSVFDFCTWDSEARQIVWRDRAEERPIVLDPPAPIEHFLEPCDLNGDGHLDVLIAASGRPYVSYGDGHGLATAVPYRLALSSSVSADIPVPLAVGDVTGDGAADFVFDDGVMVSNSASGDAFPTYVTEHPNSGARWTTAAIADLNGNGKPDVVAASNAGPGIDFFNGTGTVHLIGSSLPTGGPVQHLAVEDLDGDLTNDLALIATGASGQVGDALMIAFGSFGGLPSPPVQVARVHNAEQLGAWREFGIGHLIVASTESVGGRRSGTLTLLDGNSDRLPYAPYGLSTVSPDGVLQGSNALALTVGAFTTNGVEEVLALAVQAFEKPLEFWLGSTLQAEASTPLRLDGALDPLLRPVSGTVAAPTVRIASASADLDRDGRDESLWVIPTADGRCALSVYDVTRDGGGRLLNRGMLLLDDPCASAVLLPVDADGDGSIDVALLTGGGDDAGPRLLLLWNDGTGAFSTDRVTVVSGDDSPRAFTALPAGTTRPFSLVYVTRSAAMIAPRANGSRDFEPGRLLAPLEEGSGVVAADVNGDGVLDLAIADAGNIDVHAARLKTP